MIFIIALRNKGIFGWSTRKAVIVIEQLMRNLTIEKIEEIYIGNCMEDNFFKRNCWR
jgi:hypothetical protein